MHWPGAGVAGRLGVTSELTDDRARGSPQHLSHTANGVLELNQTGQRHAVFGLEVLVTLGWAALHLVTLVGGKCCTSGLNAPRAMFNATPHPAATP